MENEEGKPKDAGLLVMLLLLVLGTLVMAWVADQAPPAAARPGAAAAHGR